MFYLYSFVKIVVHFRYIYLVGDNVDLSNDLIRKTYILLAVIYADSCGKSTSRRLQAESVPTESVHKNCQYEMRLEQLNIIAASPYFKYQDLYSVLLYANY